TSHGSAGLAALRPALPIHKPDEAVPVERGAVAGICPGLAGCPCQQLTGSLGAEDHPLIVHDIAAEGAETLGTNPDKFGRDLPGRDAAWSAIRL
ncbi:MAG: hypothetical protein ACLPY3_22615, partial [Solirubrobacteraceae bacterium]